MLSLDTPYCDGSLGDIGRKDDFTMTLWCGLKDLGTDPFDTSICSLIAT